MTHADPKPLTSHKAGTIKGSPQIAGDKSISHRAIMFGALAAGETTISGLLEGEDVLATAAAMRQMGATIKKDEDTSIWHVTGVGLGHLEQPTQPLDMGNSGTSCRLLMGLVAGHAIKADFIGDASLSKRPMGRIITPLAQMGVTCESNTDQTLPLTVHGQTLPTPITYCLPVASAQVKSAILLAGLNADGQTTIIEEKPTRDYTENMLRAFGATVTTTQQDDGAFAITIDGKPTLTPCHIDVPADPSSAAFPAVAAVINKGSNLTLKNIGMNDRRNGLYLTLIEMGANLKLTNQRIESGEVVADIIIKGDANLKGITVPADRAPSMIDEYPILAMAAACAKGTTHMEGLEELRVKESDRLQMTYEGLKACGVECEMTEDSLTIHGTGAPPKGGAIITTALDHRIAMSFLILGTVTQQPVTVDDGSPIATSFPDFVSMMNKLGADIK